MTKNIIETFDLEDRDSKLSDLQVEQVAIYNKTRRLVVSLISQSFITQAEIEKVRLEIEEKYEKQVAVELKLKYDTEIHKLVFIEDYYEWLKRGLKLKKPLMYAILASCETLVTEELITLELTAVQKEVLEKHEFRQTLIRDLREKYDLEINIEYKLIDNTDKANQTVASEEEKARKELSTMSVVREEAPKTDIADKPKKESNENLIYGKEIKEAPIKICDLEQDGAAIVVCGEYFNLEERALRNGEKTLLSFFITDKTASTTVKVFIENGKLKDLKDKLSGAKCIKVQGNYQYDSFSKDYSILARNIEKAAPFVLRMDSYEGTKRVELHAHTKMSEMDAVCSAEELIKTAERWGHKAIGITDHGVVQAFPEAAHVKTNVRILYGVEAYIADDLGKIATGTKNQDFSGSYVVFDIETTGLNPSMDKITEIGAVKIVDKKIVDRYSTFVNPGVPIPYRITELTGITDEMVADAPSMDTILPAFLSFVGESAVVAHNAPFDTSFIRHFAHLQKVKFDPTVIDTVNLSRSLFKELKNHKLNTVADHLGVSLIGHHRAVNDAEATANIFLKMVEILEQKEVRTVDEMNTKVLDVNPKNLKSYHAILYAKSTAAIPHLYKLVSDSHVKYFKRHPIIPKSEINLHREHFILGSACEAGELYSALLGGKDEAEIRKIVQFYDYLEVQPIGNNAFMISDAKDDYRMIGSSEDLQRMNQKIVSLGERYNKPVVATSDAHFIDPEDDLIRKILLKGKGFKDGDRDSNLYLKTTSEMLDEFSYLGEEKAYEIVVENTNRICEMIEPTSPLSEEKATPQFENSEEDLRKICHENMVKIYGENPPSEVTDRLNIELNSIIHNGYTVLYIIAEKLVRKSNEDGYLVGSRGSVGSSFAATMAGITEVNPLPAHYVCPACKYADFTSEMVTSFVGNSGCDLPDASCPHCGEQMEKLGHDIPFQTFLGFEADKEPDIDLNFSGDYQAKAHQYTEELFGKGRAYRAGTIGTLADKTAYGYVVKYFEEKDMTVSRAEVQRLINKCVGVKKTTGQHPGGIVVLPKDKEIYAFCPIQWPANDDTVSLETTHFDYHSIDRNLLKLDILGHDDPTMIKLLEDLTGVDAKTIPFDDSKVMSLFNDLSALGISAEDIGGCTVGTLGIPEFGTSFVIEMVKDTKPKRFSDLVRISGLSHGTDVWVNNAQSLIKNNKATIREVISTRDDIMLFLISKGMDKKMSFKIMESVRKGKGLTEEWEEAMKQNGNLPDWYINSCKTIKYMFPKAHAVAYVMMAWRIAYFKVYHPLDYYTAFFSVRAGSFDYELMCQGKDRLNLNIKEYEEKEKNKQITAKEKETLKDMKIVQEMYARGFDFVELDIYRSKAKKFKIIEGKIMPSFMTIAGLGDSVAQKIEEEQTKGEYTSIEDFKDRTKTNKTVLELLIRMGLLKGLPESNQMTLVM